MQRSFTEEKTFDTIDFTLQSLSPGDYEHCSFLNCNFSGADLSYFLFEECAFTGCNLSMAKLNQASMKDVQFRECKLTGIRFDQCTPFLFEVGFDHCVVNLCSFYNLKLKKTIFKDSPLHETDFSECDLTEAVFANCDLAGTVFDRTTLIKADLRTAFNYTIDPEINKIKKAKFSKEGLAGLLVKYDLSIS